MCNIPTNQPALKLYRRIADILLCLGIILWSWIVPCRALELAPEGASELVPVETIQSMLDSFRSFSTLLLVLLALALVVIIYLIFALKTAQHQTQALIDLIKQVDLMKETVARIASQVRKANLGDRGGDIDEFEIIKKGL